MVYSRTIERRNNPLTTTDNDKSIMAKHNKNSKHLSGGFEKISDKRRERDGEADGLRNQKKLLEKSGKARRAERDARWRRGLGDEVELLDMDGNPV